MIKMMDMMMENEFQTRKGTPIRRFKGLVGKSIGGQLYVHKNYAAEIIPSDVIEYGEDILKRFGPHFEYNCIMLDSKRDIIRFDECPDFDAAREPHVGNYIVIDLKGAKPPYKGYSNSIWHHKWLWVRDDYAGFNIDKAKEWSKLWLSKLGEPAKGTDVSWTPQLAKHGLKEADELDGVYLGALDRNGENMQPVFSVNQLTRHPDYMAVSDKRWRYYPDLEQLDWQGQPTEQEHEGTKEFLAQRGLMVKQVHYLAGSTKTAGK